MATPARQKPAVPKTDDSTLRRFVGYRLKRAFNVFRSDLAAVLEPFGLRMMTYSTLVLIVDNPGLRPSRLAEALAIERPNMVVLLDELEAQGLIQRQPDRSDRRAHTLTATLQGQRLCAQAVAANDTHEAALLAGIAEADRAVFLEVLRRIERAGHEASS